MMRLRFPAGSGFSSLGAALTWSAGYLLLYLLLDWISYIRPLQGLNITPWNPQPALAIALLLRHPSALWLVWLGLLLAEVVMRDVPGNWWAATITSLILGGLYALIARSLVRFLGPRPSLNTPRDLAWFTLVAAVGALLCGVTYVAAYAGTSLGTPTVVLGAIARYWVGDLVGLLVMLPIVLLMVDPVRRPALALAARQRHWLLFTALLALLLWALLGPGSGIYLRFFYLLFIPVVLFAAVLGVQGAVLAASLTQLGLLVTVQVFPQPDLTLFELQLLMAAITMTGLLVGVLVDERGRTAEALRESMRLATAGQMAASLAHELSQPLTALHNYAQACRALVSGMPPLPDQRREHLDRVARQIADNVQRAGDIIRRLRDFFKTGAIQLESCAIGDLVETALAAHRQRAALTRIELRTRLAPDLPPAQIDPVQIGIVLRNLLDNGLYAAAAGGHGGWVELEVSRQDEQLLVQVRDSGPGVDAARLPTLFEPGASDKPDGMGVGLGISRAIVEAHGGRLWAVADGRGHFCLTLPVAPADA